MKPTSILVVSFEIEVRGPRRARGLSQNCGVGDTGFEPDIDDVIVDVEMFAFGAVGARNARRQQTLFAFVFVVVRAMATFFLWHAEPGVGTLGKKERGDMFEQRRIANEGIRMLFRCSPC